MKTCPACDHRYDDDSLNFCLADGSLLLPGGRGGNEQRTVSMQQTPPTKPNPAFNRQTGRSSAQNPGLPPGPRNWGNPGAVPRSAPRKSGKSFLIFGVLGALAILSVVGLVAVIGFVAALSSRPKLPEPPRTNTAKTGTPLVDDLSAWRRESSDLGKTEYIGSDFVMSSKQAGFFYVLVTWNLDFKTTNATTKVTVRNVNNLLTPLGYGLLIHSDPKVALVKDYVFLIDSTTGSYRIAMHLAKKEVSLIKWTKFNSIRRGTEPNEIEVCDDNRNMTLVINGAEAITIKNTTNYQEGVVGLYAGDAIPIAFSNLRLTK